MTITLQAGHTYRTRDAQYEHTIDRISDEPTIDRISDEGERHGPIAWAGRLAWWQNTGKGSVGQDLPSDLVEEVLSAAAEPPNPVRQRTVTEIVPGTYGNAWGGETHGGTVAFSYHGQMCTAEELRALAATATQLADALDIIASESQS